MESKITALVLIMMPVGPMPTNQIDLSNNVPLVATDKSQVHP
jgi:hypothetical protein